jgi:hypothetical protein
MLQRGIIAIWSGDVVDIPTGWQLADGSNGTPNLSGRFVIGSSSTYPVGDTGGASSHNHSWSDAHRHRITNDGGTYDRGTSSTNMRFVKYRTLSGNFSTENELPSNYKLAYIMKMGGFDYDEQTLKAGSILMWNGASDNPPRGFDFCDGSGNTPDLRDKFVIGAGSTYNPGDLSTTSSHSHSFTSTSHTHVLFLSSGSSIRLGTDVSRTSRGGTVLGTSGSKSHIPPYYALAYIMATADITVRDIASGLISIWSGSVGTIPTGNGWVLCDGNNSTPDMRDRFVYGSATPGSTGGSAQHNHTYSAAEHDHAEGCTKSTLTPYGPRTSTANNDCRTHDKTPTGESVGNATSLPPYHALPYMMLS